MRELVTGRPRRMLTDDGVRLVADVDDAASLWFAVPLEYADLFSDLADHVAVGLLLPAMRYGRDLRVGGTVTDALLHRLNHDVQSLVRAVHPTYRRIQVTADDTIGARPAPPGVATGFSGGVDSFATLREYAIDPAVPADLRITHLLNNNVGAHGDGGRALWVKRYTSLLPVAHGLGLPFVRVDSNLEEHYPQMGFMQTVTFRNAAAIHALGGGIGRAYHASEGAFGNIRMPPPHGDIALAGAMTFSLLSTPSLTQESTSSGASRIERTLALVGNPYARYLDVCIDADPGRTVNCSRCWKCMRTMLTLEIAGHLDEFVPDVFRREPYEQRKPTYYGELLASTEPNDIELVQYGERNGWRWGVRARTRAAGTRAKEWGRARARVLRGEKG